MSLKRSLCALVITILSAAALDATVVVPPTFDKLISDADAIVYSEVIEQNTRWERRGTRTLIITDVTLRVREVLKGQSDAIRTIQILGGTIGDVTHRIPGTPRFFVGDRDVLFLKGGRGAVSPVMGLFHGRFRVVEGANGVGEFIANHARQPLSSIRDYVQPQRLGAGQRAVSLNEFLQVIRTSVGR